MKILILIILSLLSPISFAAEPAVATGVWSDEEAHQVVKDLQSFPTRKAAIEKLQAKGTLPGKYGSEVYSYFLKNADPQNLNSLVPEIVSKLAQDDLEFFKFVEKYKGVTDSTAQTQFANFAKRFGVKSPKVFEVLTPFLESTDADVRFASATALASLGYKSPLVVKELLMAFQQAKPGEERAPCESLVAIEDSNPAIEKAILEKLAPPTSPETKEAVLYCLSTAKSLTKQEKLVVLPLLDDQNEKVRGSALHAGALLQPMDDAIISKILSKLNDPVMEVGLKALVALRKGAGSSHRVHLELIKIAQEPTFVGRRAAESLIEIKISDPRTIQAIAKLLKETKLTKLAKQRLISVAGGVSAGRESFRIPLIELLKDAEKAVAFEAVQAIASLKLEDKITQKALAEALVENPMAVTKDPSAQDIANFLNDPTKRVGTTSANVLNEMKEIDPSVQDYLAEKFLVVEDPTLILTLMTLKPFNEKVQLRFVSALANPNHRERALRILKSWKALGPKTRAALTKLSASDSEAKELLSSIEGHSFNK